MRKFMFVALFAFLVLKSAAAADTGLKLVLPQNRAVFQTNEWIDLSVTRIAPEAVAAKSISITLSGVEDKSKITAAFELVPNRPTEHYHVNGWLLRPGKYAVETSAGGVSANTEILVVSHLRQSDFRLVNWGQAKGPEQLVQGEESLGFNLFYGQNTKAEGASLIRAGVDYINCCTMGGAHQMDIRQECDWSDPYVTKGGTVRVVREAMMDRMKPNIPGVHFYDEPGLTWGKDPETGAMTPHMIPWQHRSFEAAFGVPAPNYKKVDPKNPESVKQWDFWAHWKLGFLDAAWKEAQFGVSWVKPDMLSLNQSQYGFAAFTDGYYFNVTRSLPITSGHGGYHDWGPGYFNPSFFLECARARDFAKPNWYLPTWYGNTTSDQFRLEQYLSFMTGIQGMISPPDIEPARNAGPRQGVVESNQTMLKLGPIFTTMPVTKPPVAILYSLSQVIDDQTNDMDANYLHEVRHGHNLPLVYLAGKMLQHQFTFVLDEDIVDGTLANDHKVCLLTSIDYLAPKVVAALEDFVVKGGIVIQTADSKVVVKGATKLSIEPRMPDHEKLTELAKVKNYKDMAPFLTVGKWMEGAQAFAKGLKTEFDRFDIQPVFECDTPGIVASRQASGDVEYLFAVNASWDEVEGKNLSMKPVTATITLPADGRAIYDAVTGGEVTEFQKKENNLVGAFRFGPGQMRVFARTTHAIKAPVISAPVVERTMTAEQAPIKVSCNITMLDETGEVMSGSIPLHIVIVDPYDSDRYVFYKATRNGTLSLEFPLAANDPLGRWAVRVEDLLRGIHGKGSVVVSFFNYEPPKKFAAIAGSTRRAVVALNDAENVFRFARLHNEVTLVKGKSPFNDAAAERLAKILKPWGVTCKTMELADAAKARVLTEDEAKTWCGLGTGRSKPGEGGSVPIEAGFAVQGPVILLGNPDDNPIIKFLTEQRFLPYTPVPNEFPGAARGMLAWQRDGVGRMQDSITLIAYDEAGMSEAVGSLYEAVAGMEPLTKWTLPDSHEIVKASFAHERQIVNRRWQIRLPDRIEALKIDGDNIIAYTHDGSECTVDKNAKKSTSKVIAPADYQKAVKDLTPAETPELKAAMKANERPERLMKMGLVAGEYKAFAYWGGDLRVINKDGAIIFAPHFPNDITALAYFDKTIIVGLADGRLMTIWGNLIVPQPIR